METLTKAQIIKGLYEIENEIEMRFKKYPCFYQEYVHKTDLLKQIRSKLNF